MTNRVVYPYIPNSAPKAKKKMLEELGIKSIEELYAAIPENLKFTKELNLPSPILSEAQLEQHVKSLLDKNISTSEVLSFLGAGCYPHYVPAVCDEINSRYEFLTAYSGKTYEDHGRYQALYEFASMMGDLLNMDVVALPTYDGLQAAATSLRMALNITNRRKILISQNIQPDKLSKIQEFLGYRAQIETFDIEAKTGQLNCESIEKKLKDDVAAVFFENPNYIGIIETEGNIVANLAHKVGALCVVSADPISLGILKPPADYGADITCGDIQSLGIHMQFGGGHAGYIAVHNDQKFINEIPLRIVGFVPTIVEGEYGFGEITFERTSLISREQGKEWVGTMANLWGITAGVYLALMGKKGIVDIGWTILSNTNYAIKAVSKIPKVKIKYPQSSHFREFIIDFSGCGKSVAEINTALLQRGIFGGYDFTGKIDGFDNCAMYCFTEIHTREDIDRLVHNLKEVIL